jgi:hypothetical protein
VSDYINTIGMKPRRFHKPHKWSKSVKRIMALMHKQKGGGK